MKTLSIDIETFSSVDLRKAGVYRYVESPDFEILLISFSIDDNSPPSLIDCANGEFLFELAGWLRDPAIKKTAYNANFERTCLAKDFGILLPPEQWECTQAKGLYCGLPGNLEAVSKALKLDQGKMTEGKALIKYFCSPCKPTKTNGQRTRNLPEHDPEKWEKFKEYCKQDVIVETAIRKRLSSFDWPEKEKKLWYLDQKINDRGVLIDQQFVKNAIKFDLEYGAKLDTEARELTGLDNPNSPAQLKQWMKEQTGEEITTINKHFLLELDDAIEDFGSDYDNFRRMVTIRQEMSKTSVKKYPMMLQSVCKDGLLRGLFQYGGANRTMRWAGRKTQPQNLPKTKMKHLDLARKIVKWGELTLMEIIFGNVPDALSNLVRTSFIPTPGNKLLVTDFSAIEARVLAWLSGEKWRMDVFNTHGKLYEASASQMFHVPLEEVTKESDLRNTGKMSELALGYQGGPDALTRIEISNMIPKEKRIPEADKPRIVKLWRSASPKIVKLWNDLEEAGWEAVQNPGVKVTFRHGIEFIVNKNVLFVKLPSGRSLHYLNPRIAVGRHGGMTLTYQGMEQTRHIWIRMDTYGGKLTENIVQAIARDCLADAMIRLDDAGFDICLHVHDEVVMDEPETSNIKLVNQIMSQPIPWAKGLPLKADSFETYYYKKD